MLDNATSLPPDGTTLHPSAGPAHSLAAEAATALCFDGSVHAVMMATPQDLEDFIVGFAWTEGISRVCPPPEVIVQKNGIEVRAWLDGSDAEALRRRKRTMLGPVGCGLCGIDSLAEAARAAPRVPDGLRIPTGDLSRAERALRAAQPLRARTGAVHAAGFWVPGDGLLLVREDVGRHNALDKLAGALARGGIEPSTGAVLLTSRVSVDLVQKTAMIGAPLLMALSAPTDLAVATADAAGLTLVTGIAKPRPTLHTHPRRIVR